MIVLDTHVALWLALDSDVLGRRTRPIGMRAASAKELAISAVSFWEVAMLISKRRLRSSDPTKELRRQILDAGVIELPLTGEIAILAGELDSLRADPTDRFIAATAILNGATLVTADERLLRWRHDLVRQNAEL